MSERKDYWEAIFVGFSWLLIGTIAFAWGLAVGRAEQKKLDEPSVVIHESNPNELPVKKGVPCEAPFKIRVEFDQYMRAATWTCEAVQR